MRGSCQLRSATWAAAAVVLVLAGVASGQAKPTGFSDEAVERAIEAGKRYLWSLYQESGDPWPDHRGDRDQNGNFVPYVNYGGRMALAMYALLAGGEKYTDPRMKRGLEWLGKIDCKGTYTLGIRAQIWAMLPRNLGRALLIKDAERLVKSVAQPGRVGDPARLYSYGTYTYLSDGRAGPGGDHSNTQYGILGVWAAAAANVEVPRGYWELIYKHWIMTQNTEGGWTYNNTPGEASKGTMVAAGRSDLELAPFILFVPVIAIFLTVLSLNYLGDVVRDRFDVRESAL